MIVLGYAVILAYVFALIFLLGPLLVKAANGETSRKVIHTMLFMVWVFIDLFFRNTVHQIVIPVIFLVLNTLSYKFKIYKSVEREENNHLGTIYFAIAITVVMTLARFFPALYYPSGAAAFCLTFGDGFAALMGYNFPSRKLRGGKSVLGFLSCFGASVLCLAVFRLLYWQELSIPAILILAAFAAISELVGKGLDNFTVTFCVFALSALMAFFPEPRLLWGLGLAAAVFFLVYLTGAITYAGSLLAMGIVFCFCFFGGGVGIGFLLSCYLAIFAIGYLRKKRRPAGAGQEKHSRGFVQILINGGLGTLFVILSGVLEDRGLLLAAMVSIGGNFIDSVSSDVGTLSRKQPYDPIRRTHIPSGLSGGMTVLGTGSALAGSVLIGVFCSVFLKLTLPWSLAVSALVFLQTLVDTALGSWIQVKYRCPQCGALTERPSHCGIATEHHSGLPFINNNAVNLISSLAISLLAWAVF